MQKALFARGLVRNGQKPGQVSSSRQPCATLLVPAQRRRELGNCGMLANIE